MKIFTLAFTIIAIALIIYNATKIDFLNVLENESVVALITILAAFCGILLLQILRISKKIEAKTK